ncbi:MAG: tRNA guanosine(34) transglycosylase Tgt [Patescibacteria group bacterium]
MITFRILKKALRSRARLGIMATPHGAVETPAMVGVATQAALKCLTNDEIPLTKTQILIANTFHLHLRPGEQLIGRAGGLHKFSGIPVPLMTDSGGYQVFSLGFGRDTKTGKIAKTAHKDAEASVGRGAQPKNIKITPDGVRFHSPIDGREIFIGPKESIRIQQKLGGDIMFTFDECTSPFVSRSYIEHALRQNHRWAENSLKARSTDQALFGIVHGSRFRDLRRASANFINGLGFDGFGIGGDLGDVTQEKRTMINILRWTTPLLDETKPRHLLGIGLIEDMERIVKEGIDLFDCTEPTRAGRHGIAYTRAGRIDLSKAIFLGDKKPLDPQCSCGVCAAYKRNYLAHLIRAGEITGLRHLSFHNLYFFNSAVEKIREKIKKGRM